MNIELIKNQLQQCRLHFDAGLKGSRVEMGNARVVYAGVLKMIAGTEFAKAPKLVSVLVKIDADLTANGV